jgi:hypothetical protein
MATLPKVLISRADYQIGGGVALRLRTQGPDDKIIPDIGLDSRFRQRGDFGKERGKEPFRLGFWVGAIPRSTSIAMAAL